jgi:hypothetical protein
MGPANDIRESRGMKGFVVRMELPDGLPDGYPFFIQYLTELIELIVSNHAEILPVPEYP